MAAKLKRQITPEGECIRKRLRTNAAYRILDQTCSFQQGGCWIAANAIQRQYGGQLAAVVTDRRGEDHPLMIEHFVVERDGLYYDSEGAQTKDQLVARMAEDELWDLRKTRVNIVPFEPDFLTRSGADRNEGKIQAIQTLLASCARPTPARPRRRPR